VFWQSWSVGDGAQRVIHLDIIITIIIIDVISITVYIQMKNETKDTKNTAATSSVLATFQQAIRYDASFTNVKFMLKQTSQIHSAVN